ncbi:MAG: hypothetical protein ACR2QC_10135 [Gammaproteobacteria bacterium]
MNKIGAAARESFRESVRIYWTLARISLPLLAAIRFLDEHFNIVAHAGTLLSPLMSWADLPGAAGIVWATAIFLQLYAAMLVLASLWTQLDLTAAQATTLAAMILTAHALPVELRIVQKAGVRMRAMLLMRLVGALGIGALLAAIYKTGGWLQTPATLHFAPPPQIPGWGAWAAAQAKNWILIYAVILVLVIFIRVLKATHAERFLIALLAPALRRMGIGARATTTTLIGMTLGLSYGGALLIDESRRGDVNRRDMLCALTLLCLCHSIIEDTLAMLLVGAHISGVLFGRIIFAFAVMFVFAKIVNRMSDSALSRWLLIAR